MIASALRALGPHRLEHFLGDLAGDRVVHDARRAARRARPPPRGSARSRGSSRLSAPESSPITQLAASFGWPPSRAHDGLVVVGEFAARGQHAGVVGGQPVLAAEARGLLVRQLRQRGAHGLDRGLVDHERQQVGIREVAVVVRFFLRAHRPRLAAVRVVQARLLHDLAAALDQLDLARDLVVDRLLDEAERVQVLDLGARAELRLALRAHRDVRVAAERAFLHVAVADLEVAHERVDLLHVRDGFLGRAHVGLRDDLEQRRAGAVQVDAREPVEVLVQRLARVLLEVRARDADRLLRAVLEHDVERAVLARSAARTG